MRAASGRTVTTKPRLSETDSSARSCLLVFVSPTSPRARTRQDDAGGAPRCRLSPPRRFIYFRPPPQCTYHAARINLEQTKHTQSRRNKGAREKEIYKGGSSTHSTRRGAEIRLFLVVTGEEMKASCNRRAASRERAKRQGRQSARDRVFSHGLNAKFKGPEKNRRRIGQSKCEEGRHESFSGFLFSSLLFPSHMHFRNGSRVLRPRNFAVACWAATLAETTRDPSALLSRRAYRG